MTRLREMLVAYTQESDRYLKENKDPYGFFENLVSKIKNSLEKTFSEHQLYRLILSSYKSPQELQSYYKQPNKVFKQLINKFLTILLCYEVISRQFHVKHIYNTIFDLDSSALREFVILSKSGELRLLSKELVTYLNIIKQNAMTAKKSRQYDESFVNHQVNIYVDVLNKNKINKEDFDELKRIVILKLGVGWLHRLEKAMKSHEIKINTVKEESESSWHPLNSTFMIRWEEIILANTPIDIDSEMENNIRPKA